MFQLISSIWYNTSILNTIKKGAIMSLRDQITEQFEIYIAESKRFEENGVKVAATRARKALAEIGKLAKEERKEIEG